MKRLVAALAGAIVFSLAVSSLAMADSATISAVDAGGGQMTATVTTTSTSCTTFGSCGWFGFVVERHSSLPCKDDETFLRAVLPFQEKAGTATSTFTFRPFFPRYTKLCVILSNSAGTASVGESILTLPAGYGYQRSTAYNCVNFSSQSAAEYYLELYLGDPSRLDADHDGSACEDNKCPCGAESIPPEPEPPAIPLVPTSVTPTAATPECTEAKRGERQAREAADRANRFLRTHFGLKPSVAAKWRKRSKKATHRLTLDKRWVEEVCVT